MTLFLLIIIFFLLFWRVVFWLDYAEMTPVSNAPSVDAQIVGNAFVQKYYTHLYEKPAEVYRFYLEESVLGRPGLDGEMVSVKSLKVSHY